MRLRVKPNSRWVLPNHVRLGGQILKAIRELYQKIACEKSVIKEGILARIITHLNPFWLDSVSFSGYSSDLTFVLER